VGADAQSVRANRRFRSQGTEDAVHNVTTRAFDGLGNKLCEVRPRGGSPFSNADNSLAGMKVGDLQATVCAYPYATNWSYDEESKLLSVVDAQNGKTSFVYDKARNLIATQDANGHLTTYEYDAEKAMARRGHRVGRRERRNPAR
jgi:YD repeat-containing protein